MYNPHNDKKLIRLASLVGTDAENPEDKLCDYVAKLLEDKIQEAKKAHEIKIANFITKHLASGDLEETLLAQLKSDRTENKDA